MRWIWSSIWAGLKKKGFHDVQTEIHTLKDICDDKILKVIVETCFLTEEEKIKMCEVVTEAGADFHQNIYRLWKRRCNF